jgi:hypothetical protein
MSGMFSSEFGTGASVPPNLTSFTEYFVTFNVEDKTETFSHNLSNIIIPDGNKLELRVDPASTPFLSSISSAEPSI